MADDDSSARESTKWILEAMSNEELVVEGCVTGRECLERLKQSPPIDLILLDMSMPDGNGEDVIREVLGMDPLPTLRIVPVTAWGSEWKEKFPMKDIRDTEAYKRIVQENAYDGLKDPKSFVYYLRSLLGINGDPGGLTHAA